MFALFWYGWEIAADSWRYQEVSWNSPARIQIYFFKTLIPVAGFLMMLQGWPSLDAAGWPCVTVIWLANGSTTCARPRTC